MIPASTRRPPSGIPKLLAGLLCLAALATATIATAHPYGPRYYSLRSELRLTDSGLQATVVLEIPTMKVLREFSRMYGHLEELGSEEDEAYRELQYNRLSEGLGLMMNGEAVEGRWLPADVPINGKGGENFFLYILTFQPTVPLVLGGPTEVVLQNDSYSGVPMYYSAFAQAEGGWVVASNSVSELLGEASTQEDVSENPAGWTRDPSARSLRVQFRPSATP